MPLFNDIIFDDNNIINENSIQNTELDNNKLKIKINNLIHKNNELEIKLTKLTEEYEFLLEKYSKLEVINDKYNYNII